MRPGNVIAGLIGYCLTIICHMGSMGHMKTTIDIQDELLTRAKRHARKTGRPLRAVVEDGLRRALSAADTHQGYILPDHSMGQSGGRDPLEAYSWQDLREIIYGDPEDR